MRIHKLRRAGFALLPVLLAAVFATPWLSARPLEIFFIDVEGGQSTLIVSPSGQSLLIDTGWRGFDGRDANRIVPRPRRPRSRRSIICSSPTIIAIMWAACRNWPIR